MTGGRDGRPGAKWVGLLVAAALITVPGAMLPHAAGTSDRASVAAFPGPTPSLAHPLAPKEFPVVFSESGLPGGLTFAVTANGSVLSNATVSGVVGRVAFSLPNGSYAYSIAGVAGWHEKTVAYAGTVIVAGAAVTVPTAVFDPVRYTISFLEQGLPRGSFWEVLVPPQVGGEFASTINLTVANGTWTFEVAPVPDGSGAYLPSPETGSVVVAGANVSETITFALEPGYYPVLFVETGLPSLSGWGVDVNGVELSTDGAEISDALANGTYTYSIVAPAEYRGAPPSGALTVDGAAVTVSVPFVQILFTVQFFESGLTREYGPGLNLTLPWEVSFNGTRYAVDHPSLQIPDLTNRSYAYLVQSEGSFQVTDLLPQGTVAVAGTDLIVSLGFAPAPTYTLAFREAGLARHTDWCVTVGAPACSTTDLIKFKFLTPATYDYAVATVGTIRPLVWGVAGWGGPTGSWFLAQTKILAVRYAYPVRFTETGLPVNTLWSVRIGHQVGTSTNATVTLYLLNGTFGFRVPRVSLFVATPRTGHFQVSGGPVAISVTFVDPPRGKVPADSPSALPLARPQPGVVAGIRSSA